MPVFDGTFIAAAFGLLGTLIGGILAHKKGNSPNRFIAVGIIIMILILGLCRLAWRYGWESDILDIHPSTESNSELNVGQSPDFDASIGSSNKREPTDSADDAENPSEDTMTNDLGKLQYEIFDAYQGTTYTLRLSDGKDIAMVYCGSVTFPERDYTQSVYLYCAVPENKDESSVRSAAYVFAPISYGTEYREGNKLYEGGWYLTSSSGEGAYLYRVQTVESDQ